MPALTANFHAHLHLASNDDVQGEDLPLEQW